MIKGYADLVKKGDISPLLGYKYYEGYHFKEIMKRLNHKHVPTKYILGCVKKGEISKMTKSSISYI